MKILYYIILYAQICFRKYIRLLFIKIKRKKLFFLIESTRCQIYKHSQVTRETIYGIEPLLKSGSLATRAFLLKYFSFRIRGKKKREKFKAGQSILINPNFAKHFDRHIVFQIMFK